MFRLLRKIGVRLLGRERFIRLKHGIWAFKKIWRDEYCMEKEMDDSEVVDGWVRPKVIAAKFVIDIYRV